MVQEAQEEITSAGELRWALPVPLAVPPDHLVYQVNVFEESILLNHFDDGQVTTRLVSATDIAQAFTRELRFQSGILPRGAVWWGTGPEGPQVALWRPTRVWKVALVTEAFQPPRRFTLPLPGLVFLCAPERAPRVYAARDRPRSLEWPLYHAPLYNVFASGSTCAGTHKYSQRVEEAPESFMVSFFSPAGHSEGRSKKHPKDLLALWEELEGKRHYPLRDLVFLGTLKEVLGLREEGGR